MIGSKSHMQFLSLNLLLHCVVMFLINLTDIIAFAGVANCRNENPFNSLKLL